MRNQLAVYGTLLALIVILGLVALSGSLLLTAAPLVLFIVASDLFAKPVRLAVTRRLSAARVGPSTPVRVTVSIENRGPAVPEVIVTDRVPAGLTVIEGSPRAALVLDTGGCFSFSYAVAGGRGSYAFDGTAVEVAGDFPLRAGTLEYSNPRELVMLPDHRALARIPIAPRRTLVYAGSLPARRGGDGTEFYDVRLHTGRTEPRRVNWRASARRPGELYVNEFQQERVADIGIILDARRRAYPAALGDGLFEAAAHAAASLADVLLDQGNRVGFLAYGLSVDWTVPGFGRIQKQRVLTRIARVVPGDSYVFTSLGAIPDRLLPAGSQLLLVSPLTPEDAAAVARLGALGYAVLVVSPDPVRSRPAGDGNPAAVLALRVVQAERRVLLHRLRRRGIPVVDWDIREPLDAAISSSIGVIKAAWRHRGR